MPESTDDKFDVLLKRMLSVKPLSKAEISTRIKAERGAKRKAAEEAAKKLLEKNRQYRSKKT
jgi:hypothetical protein